MTHTLKLCTPYVAQGHFDLTCDLSISIQPTLPLRNEKASVAKALAPFIQIKIHFKRNSTHCTAGAEAEISDKCSPT